MSTAIEILKAEGYKTVSEKYYRHIKLWREWYKGKVDEFHNYKVFNGQRHVKVERYSLGMAKKVCEDWANLLMNEKVAVTLEGEQEQDFFDKVCKENNWLVKVSEAQEFKSALGTVAYVVRVDNASVSSAGNITGTDDTEIKIDYVTAENIFPLAWENNVITECAFANNLSRGDERYVYMQIHHKDGKQYVIDNKMYRNKEDNLSEVTLSSVAGYEDIPPVIRTGSETPQFVIDRPNIANNIDLTIPMGLSVYANAIDALKGVDIAYDSYVNEFILGKKRLMVKPEAHKNLDGEPVFDPNDTLFYVLPEDSDGSAPVQSIDSPLRVTDHAVAIQDMLNMLSSRCGFGEDHYKFNGGNVQTATAIISQNSTLFRSIKKHEIILSEAIEELARIILRLGNQYLNAGLNEEVEISIDFDDSIIEDEATDFGRDMTMLNAGIISQAEFRSKWMNEDIETSKQAIAEIVADMMARQLEPQQDIE